MSKYESKTTDDHQTIKDWVEEREGKPALVDGVVDKDGGGGMLRIDFLDGSEGSLNDISWDKFFEIFDDNNLLFLYQEETKDGETSRFCKFIDKE